MGARTRGRRPVLPFPFGRAIPRSPENSNVLVRSIVAMRSRLLIELASNARICFCVAALAELTPLRRTAAHARCRTVLDRSRLYRSKQIAPPVGIGAYRRTRPRPKLKSDL